MVQECLALGQTNEIEERNIDGLKKILTNRFR